MAWWHGCMCSHTNHLLRLSPHHYRHHYSPAVKKSQVTNANYQCSDSSAKGIWWGKNTNKLSKSVCSGQSVAGATINKFLSQTQMYKHKGSAVLYAMRSSVSVMSQTNKSFFKYFHIHNLRLCQTNLCQEAAMG